MKNYYLSTVSVLLLVIISSTLVFSQSFEESLIQDLKWREIGPANMSGRVTDIEALNNDFSHVIVASASGGVWKTVNAGTTWEPIFDNYGSASIGAVALFQNNPDIIWVGTGEANVRNSVGWGDGVYKSTDGGKTFNNMGLKESHHIGGMALHPDDPNIAYVAAQGHLWGYNDERGLYKTTDGGMTWKKLTNGLPDDDKTGANDIKIHPDNPNILYVSYWERIRTAYNFKSGGKKSGIYKSTDGGNSWKQLSNGIPEGELGKIGISIYKSNPNIVMAIVEHSFQPAQNSPDYKDMTKLGTGVYRSEDGGDSWTFVNRYNSRPFYYSQIFINPSDDQRVYTMGGTAQTSMDGGKTFKNSMPGIAGDFHIMWIDPQNKDRYYIGNDKGVSITHDHGTAFNFFNNYAIGQIYAISADMRDPYHVFVGLQDNGVWGVPSNTRDFNGILNDHWYKFHSGDGFYTASDPTDWTTIYTESQGGAIRRNHSIFRQRSTNIRPNATNTINWKDVVPEQKDKNRPTMRMNWNTPFLLSHFNPRNLYYGANFLFKSEDRGDHWKIISLDLSTNDPKRTNRKSGGMTRDVTGAETNATIVTISESKIKPGIIWVGTDDGRIHYTRDDGKYWKDVEKNIGGVPDGLWISRIEASHFDEATVYVTIDGHRSNEYKPYVLKSTDFGKTWENISSNLPENGSAYVIKEDHKNRNLLFLGTEFAAYYSINGGKKWTRLMNGMPTVAVHDLLIHPRDNDLIAGTHGRSAFIIDDITPLQQLTEEVTNSNLHLFDNPVSTIWEGVSRGATRGHQLYIAKNPSEMTQVSPANSPTLIGNTAAVDYYLKNAYNGDLLIEISDFYGKNTAIDTIKSNAGINRFRWDMEFDATDKQITVFETKMREILSELENLVENDSQRSRLTELNDEFSNAKTIMEKNAVRTQMTRAFRTIVPNRAFFGNSLRGTQATPGTYYLRINLYGKDHKGTITIREDPLKNDLKR